jgi:hypothetical protein
MRLAKTIRVAWLLAAVLALSGCNLPVQPEPNLEVTEAANTPEAHLATPAASQESTATLAATAVPVNPTAMQTTDPTAACPTPGSDSRLFVDEQNGFCLLYPSSFEETPYKEFVFDRVQFLGPAPASNSPEPLGASLIVESNGLANGLESFQYAQKWVDLFAPSADLEQETGLINGQAAVTLFNIAGFQSTDQSAFITANDTKYRLVLSPQIGTAPDLDDELSLIWEMVTRTIVFFPPQSEREYVAPEHVCPAETSGYSLYIHLTDGYCLLHPADFEETPDFPGNFEGGPVLVEDTAWGDLRASLTVGTFGYFSDQTLLEVLDPRADVIDTSSILETTMAGNPAVIFRDPRGPWASRQAMIMVDGFVYTLVNQPWEPVLYPDGMPYLDSIWESVTTSLAFFDPWR